MDIALFGCGFMGKIHFDALSALGLNISVYGRSEASALAFQAEKGVLPTYSDDVDQIINSQPAPALAVVAVSTDSLAPVTEKLLNWGVKRILVEKPAGIDPDEIERLSAADLDNRVFIAYNRRFYPSVMRALELIENDGGLTSLHFEFTELSDRIVKTRHAPILKENWLYGNSSHVIDMAFYMAGVPGLVDAIDLGYAQSKGQLSWHNRAARFVGAGTINQEILFSYKADWESGGGWSVEACTCQRRLILKPLEQLLVQQRGSFEIQTMELENEKISGYKAGIIDMLDAFIHHPDDARLLRLSEHNNRMRFYQTMLEGL